MPAIVSATVVRWVVMNPEATDPDDRYVEYKDNKDVSLYVEDASQENVASEIIAEYILDPRHEKEKDILLAAARDGLLQVVGIKRLEIIPPPVPPLRVKRKGPANTSKL